MVFYVGMKTDWLIYTDINTASFFFIEFDLKLDMDSLNCVGYRCGHVVLVN